MGMPLKSVAWCLVVAMGVLGVVPRGEAGFSPSQAILPSQGDRSVDLEKIQTVLETKVVKERLEQLGFTHEEIQTRLGQLSDEQMHQLALTIDELKIGGSDLLIVVAIIAIITFILVLFVVMGKKVVVR